MDIGSHVKCSIMAEIIDSKTESIRSFKVNDLLKYTVLRFWNYTFNGMSKFLGILYFQIKDRILLANDRIFFANNRILFPNDRILSAMNHGRWLYTFYDRILHHPIRISNMIVRSLDKFHLVVRRAFLFLRLVKMLVQNYNSSTCSVARYRKFEQVLFRINLV